MNHHRVVLPLAAASLVNGLATGLALGAPPSIERLAPDSTIVIAGTSDAATALERIDATRLGDLWRSPRIQELLEEIEKEMRTGMAPMLEELDLEFEDLPGAPSGPAGLALFSVQDAEVGFAVPGFLLMVDYADDVEPITELLDRMRESAERDDSVRLDFHDVREREVWSVQFVEEEHEADEEFDEFGMMAGGPEQLFEDAMSTLYFVRDGGMVMATSDLAALDHALGVIDGDEEPQLAERDDYRAMMAQIGDHEAYGAIRLNKLGPLVTAMDPTGMAMMMAPMLKQAVGDVQGIATGVRFGAGESMVDQATGIYMPNGKMGLSSLMTDATPFGQVPPFVGPSTINYSELNFDFSGVPIVLGPILRMMPIPMGQPGEGPDVTELVGQFCSTLGTKLFIVQSLERPIKIDSLQQLVAVECTRPQDLQQLLEQLGGQMGLEARDFLGHRLYTIDMDMGGMVPMGGGAPMAATGPQGLGIGGGYFFTGPAGAVEQALRSISDAKPASVTEEDDFRRALDRLGAGEVIGWGFGDLVAGMEASLEVQRLQMEEFRQMMAEEDADLLAEFDDASDWFDKLDPEMLRQYVGPTSWKAVVTDDGFVVHSFVIEPAAAGELNARGE